VSDEHNLQGSSSEHPRNYSPGAKRIRWKQGMVDWNKPRRKYSVLPSYTDPCESSSLSSAPSPDIHFPQQPDALTISRGRILEVEYSIRAMVSAGPLSSNLLVDIPIRIVNFMSLDTPPPTTDPDAAAGATSLRARYHTRLETRNNSTDEQLDGESFRLSARPSRCSDPTTFHLQSTVHSGQVDSDGVVDMVVRKASSQHREVAAESAGMDGLQSCNDKNGTITQALANSQGRARSKTISSIPQSPSSFAKSTQDKLLHTELGSSFTITGTEPPSAPTSHHDIANFTPSPTTATNHQPSHPLNISQFHSNDTSELTTRQALSVTGRVQSAPVRREEPPDQDIRPNTGRSQSDTAVRSSPTKTTLDGPSDVRKRIEELEAKMKGSAK
jgi:hypothetical protein